MEKKGITIVLVVICTLLVIALFAPFYIYKNYFSPASAASRNVKVEIKSGSTATQVAKMLEEREIIRSKLAFSIVARYAGQSARLKAGEYELDPSMSAAEILDVLVEGRVVLYSVTVQEGLTIWQTAKTIAAQGFSDYDSLVNAAGDPAILQLFKIDAPNAEGYLMPETYRFNKGATAVEIISKMIFTFSKKVEPLRKKYQDSSPLSFGEIVILASIIDKETGNIEEYDLISAVFHRRLKKKMLLQADPTVIYAIPDFDGNIRKEDLEIDSPYNTYKYRGLPPGPIANPGLKAIEAAYRPADADYLYFVATKKDGRHYFSRTLVEHNEAVKKYQLRRR
ncbi:MAG: endolytic transglycosylase MltG [Nitrospinota bacterium]